MVADLTFRYRARPDGGPVVSGRVRADGSVVTVDISRTPSLLSRPGRRRAAVAADALASQGLTVRLRSPAGWVAAAGSGVDAPHWQAVLTGSRRIRIGSLRAVAASLIGPRMFEAAVPDLRLDRRR